TPQILKFKWIIKRFCRLWRQPNLRSSFAAWAGDWFAVKKYLTGIAVSPDVTRLVDDRCAQVRDNHCKELWAICNQTPSGPELCIALQTLQTLKAKGIRAYLRRGLQAPITSDTLDLLWYLENHSNRPDIYYDNVMDLFKRLRDVKEDHQLLWY